MISISIINLGVNILALLSASYWLGKMVQRINHMDKDIEEIGHKVDRHIRDHAIKGAKTNG